MPDITEFLVNVLTQSDGWTVTIVFALYISYRFYITYQEGRKITLLEKTIFSLLENIDRNLTTLTGKMENFISRIPP